MQMFLDLVISGCPCLQEPKTPQKAYSKYPMILSDFSKIQKLV